MDRNKYDELEQIAAALSPSSRRAWIEIPVLEMSTPSEPVALLAEGVDRNSGKQRAAVEAEVALLAEGVDRNLFLIFPTSQILGRPPRGGRG